LLRALAQTREEREHLFNISSDFSSAGARERTHLKVFHNRHAGKNAPSLGHHRHPPTHQGMGRHLADRLTKEFDLSAPR
jgi:hypothetical protein